MKKVILTNLFIILTLTLRSQINILGLETPKVNEVILDTTLNIVVDIDHYNQISNVTAQVLGIQATLTPDPLNNTRFLGSISLKGLPQDSLSLLIFATDVLNYKDTADYKFVYDLPPTLVIQSPLPFSTASPTLHVSAKCIGNGPFSINVNSNASGLISNYSFMDSVDTDIDFSQYEGLAGYLFITVTDKFGVQNLNSYNLYYFVESSPYLTKVYSASSQIFDVNYNSLLVDTYDQSNRSPKPSDYGAKIIHLSTLDSLTIPYHPIYQGSSLLAPNGSLFQNNDTVYSLNQGLLSAIGYNLYPTHLADSGIFGVWQGEANAVGDNYSGYLVLTNLTNNSSVLASGPLPIGPSFSMSSKGTVVFIDQYKNSPAVKMYRNGETKIVSDSLNLLAYGDSYTSPFTDNKNVLYTKASSYLPNIGPPGTRYSIFLYNGQKDTLLSDIKIPPNNNTGNKSPLAPIGQHSAYQVNNGFIAFPNMDNNGIEQLWFGDSTGRYSQISLLGNPSYQLSLDLLNHKGELFFMNWNGEGCCPNIIRRYFATPNGNVKEICSNNGQLYYMDSSWYLALGRTLFKINTSIPPNSLSNSIKSYVKDSVTQYSLSDFSKNFNGPGSLMSVKIMGLPSNGRLLLNNVPVSTGQIISRLGLNQLTYVPNNGFTGIDTISWNGSNGIYYTSSSAEILLYNIGFPNKPSTSGFSSSYCINDSNQTLLITNFPKTGSSTFTTVLLDGSSVPVNELGQFTISPSSLTAGSHSLLLIFSNAVGADSLNMNFNVLPVANPLINLSSTLSIVNGDAETLVVNIHNLSGGGTNPLYSFAADRAFTHILQAESNSDSYSFLSSTLALGDNWIFGKMKTSDSCYTNPYIIDSIKITRNATAGLIDPDYPNQIISISPNPFKQQFMIFGLQTSKSYRLTLYSSSGKFLFSIRIMNESQWQATEINVPTGVYAIKLYDETKNKMLGYFKMLSE